MIAPRLELDDIQGNILRAHGLPVAIHLFLHVEDEESSRFWLGITAKRVTPATRDRNEPDSRVALNLSVSSAGLVALGVSPVVFDSLPLAFRQGMTSRASLLGDTGRSDPAWWPAAFKNQAVHLLLSIYARDPNTLEAAAEEFRPDARRDGLGVVHERRAQEMPGSREHFGFDDGFAQPAIRGADGGAGAQGVADRRGRFRPLPPGEFVLGYEDAEGFLPAAPPGPLGRNATYLVYRELAQDVAGFRRFVSSVADDLGKDADWVAARLIGRWQDGTPLALSPENPDPVISGDPSRINDFGYHDDPRGFRCPLGAHVRRANPRDALVFGGAMVRRHRIIRRGMPYGPPLPQGGDDDGVERGLIFQCFNANIARQFEFVQRQWCLDGDAFGLGDDPDPLLGGAIGSNKMTLHGEPPRFVSPLPQLVTTRGGEYLLTPGLRGLEALAAREVG